MNVFEEVYLFVINNADKVFSSLAFIASLIVAFAYRKGLIPLLKSALSAIGSKAEKVKEFSEESAMKTEQSLKFITDKLASYENSVESISKSLDGLIERLDDVDGERKNTESLRLIMLSQVDMLYDIFMQSSLPQYSKDAVGEKVAAMKKELSNGEK